MNCKTCKIITEMFHFFRWEMLEFGMNCKTCTHNISTGVFIFKWEIYIYLRKSVVYIVLRNICEKLSLSGVWLDKFYFDNTRHRM